MIQLQGNYWHVVIDGVIFEGVFEDVCEARLAEVCTAAGVELLQILSEVVEPLTPYTFVQISKERIAAAEAKKKTIIAQLQSAKRPDLAEYLEKFIPFYSAQKRWQMDFKSVHRDCHMTIMTPVNVDLIAAARELGLQIEEEEISTSWDIIDVIDERILPFIATLRSRMR
jgi:hypothetical protein